MNQCVGTGVLIFVSNFCLNNFTVWKTMFTYVPTCSLGASEKDAQVIDLQGHVDY